MPPSLSILWLKSGPLFPLNTGGRKRTHAMLRELSKNHQVTYLAFHSSDEPVLTEEENADYALRKRWIPLHEPKRSTPGFFFALLKNFLGSSLPWALDKWVDPAMALAIEEECQENNYDLVICDFLYPSPNLENICIEPPKLLFQHNMESQIWERMAANKRNPVSRFYFGSQFRRMYRAENRLSQEFAGIITVSPDDTDFACNRYGLTNVLGHVPTGVDTEFFSPSETPPSPKRLGFLGSMDWMPNIEAVEWFAEKILPIIWAEDPEIELVVIGRNPPPGIQALGKKHAGITVTGTVEDVRPHVSNCRALVVPLLSGGGTRIKILEAIAMGVPVVSTAVGAEGLSLVDGEHLLLAESENEIAEACLRIVREDSLRHSLAEQGRSKVIAEHSWDKATEIFLDHCRKVPRTESSPKQ